MNRGRQEGKDGGRYLELVHDGDDFCFEGFVRDFATSEVDLIPDEDDRDLHTQIPIRQSFYTRG